MAIAITKDTFSEDDHARFAGRLVDQVAHLLREAIDTQRSAPGACLPSTRSLAKRLGVSRNTVLTAYDELVGCGLVRGKRGAGMFVAIAVLPRSLRLTAISFVPNVMPIACTLGLMGCLGIDLSTATAMIASSVYPA